MDTGEISGRVRDGVVLGVTRGRAAVRQVAARRVRPRRLGPARENASFVGAVGLVAALAAVALLDPGARDLVGGAGGGWRRFVSILTSFGQGVEILVVSGVLLIACLALSPDGLSRQVRAGIVRLGWTAAFVFVAVAGSGLLASLAKNAFGRARPDHLAGGGIFEIHPLAFRADWAAFPSGHATTAGATAVVLALLAPRWRRPILAAGVVVAITRILLDAHFPSDVIAGVTLGASVTLALAHALGARGLVFAHDAAGRLVRRATPKGSGWTDVLAALIARARRG
ncbi:phosphatase PAP2 family protein [Siculibacillus lacustris]|uniref:Phosphatase PAP2 family protein n=1 Tax=Siculibacillus lacustris TaxID=1549641 RepID=A0A4Q9VFP8_9HYPH|nr:phosphatase PAP2 family protein [Siculibacillus lacustris]TBW33637.1 phosphatase PAP2 family protein [Siculibacillus lacustris]